MGPSYFLSSKNVYKTVILYRTWSLTFLICFLYMTWSPKFSNSLMLQMPFKKIGFSRICISKMLSFFNVAPNSNSIQSIEGSLATNSGIKNTERRPCTMSIFTCTRFSELYLFFHYRDRIPITLVIIFLSVHIISARSL